MSLRFTLAAAIVIFLVHPVAADPPVIDDQEIMSRFQSGLEPQIGKDGIPSADDLAKAAKSAPRKHCTVPLPSTQTPETPDYDTLSRAVHVIGTLYKCGKCDKWHQGSSATAWCLSPDGLMATNAHVFRNAKGAIMGVTDRDGNTRPVTELLGFDSATDVAIFRVLAKDLPAVPIGPAADVGAPVTVISHPAGNHFIKTTGHVARYAKRANGPKTAKTTWMSITADYAKGSSGGPVFNDKGEVVGMVSSTISLYTEPTRPKTAPAGHLQMVVKQCVPADAIRAVFETPAVVN